MHNSIYSHPRCFAAGQLCHPSFFSHGCGSVSHHFPGTLRGSWFHILLLNTRALVFWGDLGVSYFFTGKREKGKEGRFYAIGCLSVPLTGVRTSLSLNLLLLRLLERCAERITCPFRTATLRIVHLRKDLPYALARAGSWQQT